MRLLVSAFILAVTALDFAFGQPGTALHYLGLVAGICLALTVVIDRWWPNSSTPRRRPAAERPEP
jgi:hypothetical protein